MSALEELIKARATIAKIQHFAQWRYAVDTAGDSVSPIDGSACGWCAVGALLKVCGVDSSLEPSITKQRDLFPNPAAVDFLHNAAIRLFGIGVPDVNDHMGHAAVLRVYDLAIRKARVTNAQIESKT